MTTIVFLIAAIIGAAAFRFRGGGFYGTGSTTFARIIYSIIMGGVVALCFPEHWAIALSTIPAWFLGTLKGHAEYMDLGRVSGEWRKDFLCLTGRGVLWSILPAIVVSIGISPLAGIPILLSGFLQGAVYELAFHIPSGVRHLNRGPELGEALFGFVLGSGIFIGSLM